jgi:hypothetical protein
MVQLAGFYTVGKAELMTHQPFGAGVHKSSLLEECFELRS